MNKIDTSFIDFQGKFAVVVYFSGCNLHCPYCFNTEVIQSNPVYDVADVQNYIDNLGIGDVGIVFTGGEPTINSKFNEMYNKFRHYELALHTNGIVLPKSIGSFTSVILSLKGKRDVPFEYDYYLSKLQNALNFYKDVAYKELRFVDVQENKEDYDYALSILNTNNFKLNEVKNEN